ncbi:hypothetical protein [Streptomyces olivaceoviridis]|uniref:hypothetical protein n=1 Tax=Streptomyces olivaceoviridis TaxID=1921 RepID=UPI0036C36201
MPDFQIVTTDNQAHTEGHAYSHFKDLGYDSARLQAYGYEGDYVVLCFEHGLQLSIPEHRIQHIATSAV